MKTNTIFFQRRGVQTLRPFLDNGIELILPFMRIFVQIKVIIQHVNNR